MSKTMARPHPLTAIAAAAMPSVRGSKDEALNRAKLIATRDDVATGVLLANEAWALARGHANVWLGLAWRAVKMSVESRNAAITTLRQLLKDAKKANELDGAVAAKDAGKRVRSATVEVSKISTVCNAWNSGASVDGLLHYVQNVTHCKALPSEDDVSWQMMTDYAKTFSKSKAGRPAADWLKKLENFLTRNVPPEDDEIGTELHDQVTKLFNKVVAEQAIS